MKNAVVFQFVNETVRRHEKVRHACISRLSPWNRLMRQERCVFTDLLSKPGLVGIELPDLESPQGRRGCGVLAAGRAGGVLAASCLCAEQGTLISGIPLAAPKKTRTSNVQRRTGERKTTPFVCSFRLFCSTLGVRRWMFDVRIHSSHGSLRCPVSPGAHPSLRPRRHRPAEAGPW